MAELEHFFERYFEWFYSFERYLEWFYSFEHFFERSKE